MTSRERKRSRKQAEKVHHWRAVRCSGCPERCRYITFRTGLSFREVHAYLRALHEAGDFSRYRFKRRGTVLGVLHEIKRTGWEAWIADCPKRTQ